MFMLVISISIIFFSMILFFDNVNFGDEVHNRSLMLEVIIFLVEKLQGIIVISINPFNTPV
jgi:hypothetical protein